MIKFFPYNKPTLNYHAIIQSIWFCDSQELRTVLNTEWINVKCHVFIIFTETSELLHTTQGNKLYVTRYFSAVM